ncbi:MAG: FMN-binding protein [Gemmatimonadetes bacterium]|mgnify:CR=1 FL=1|jgi:FAD:protein FMN transferase|nr:FMN-binding protein [Gemmatimonadota bacterium]MBT6146141.1 FMN-binding protein [Gemmatimonadota bacterium]MBT7864450.1 FMN-binding protein [Gemmatimonadota bacterium]
MVGGLILVLATGSPGSAQPEPTPEEIGQIQVYLTETEARTRLFPDAAAFERRVTALDSATRSDLSDRLGRRVVDDSFAVYIARGDQGELLGYAAITEEVGKYRPITFMVGVKQNLSISDVAVLVYRESRGAQVRRQRFLRQYRGKSMDDPVRINRDIINITGATMSVRALNFGVRKTLALTELVYRDSRASLR